MRSTRIDLRRVLRYRTMSATNPCSGWEWCRCSLLDALARAFGDLVLSGLDRKHVDADDTVEIHAEIGGVAGEVRRIRARDQRLGRNAAGVDAGAANAPRSIIATVIPAPARRRAKGGRACPAPITMAS
jgi:hypothetical protein